MLSTLVIAFVLLAVMALLPFDRPASEAEEQPAEPPAKLALKPTRQR